MAGRSTGSGTFVSYTTRLDVFYNFSYVFVALTVVVSIVSAGQLTARAAAAEPSASAIEPPPAEAAQSAEATEATANSDVDGVEAAPPADGRRRRQRTDVARLDEVSRWLFPLAYIGAVAISLFGWLSRGQSWF